MNVQMSLLKACKTFFGSKPGQSLKEFAEEMAALTPKDRADLTAMFPSVGIDIVEAQQKAAA